MSGLMSVAVTWLQKRICRTIGSSLPASSEPLVYCRNVASYSLSYRYYFGRMLFRTSSTRRFTRYSDRWHDFSVILSRCYKDVYVNSFFPCTGRVWNSLPIEFFPLTYDFRGFKSKVNRHNLFVLLFLVTPCLIVAVQPCMEWIPIEKKLFHYENSRHGGFEADWDFSCNSMRRSGCSALNGVNPNWKKTVSLWKFQIWMARSRPRLVETDILKKSLYLMNENTYC